MAEYFVIDVSKHNGNIDFQAVKNAGVYAVIIRAGYGRETRQKDPMFEANYSAAKAAGLHIGAYWYSYADSVADAAKEAAACLRCIQGKGFDFPVYYDLEEEVTAALAGMPAPRSPRPSATPWSRRGTGRGFTPTPTGAELSGSRCTLAPLYGLVGRLPASLRHYSWPGYAPVFQHRQCGWNFRQRGLQSLHQGFSC